MICQFNGASAELLGGHALHDTLVLTDSPSTAFVRQSSCNERFLHTIRPEDDLVTLDNALATVADDDFTFKGLVYLGL